MKYLSQRNNIFLAAALLLTALLFLPSPKVDGTSPLGIVQSPFGRLFARLLTLSADKSFHSGMYLTNLPEGVSPLSSIVKEVIFASQNSKSGRLISAKEIYYYMKRVEARLNLAFTLDPSFPPAYQIYFDFLIESPMMIDLDESPEDVSVEETHFSDFYSTEEKIKRLYKAREISKKAIISYDTNNPEQILAMALAYYNLSLTYSEIYTEPLGIYNYTQHAKALNSASFIMRSLLREADKKAEVELINWPDGRKQDYQNLRNIVYSISDGTLKNRFPTIFLPLFAF